MDTSRDIRNRSRRDLHALAAIPALLLVSPTDPNPLAVTVRIHTKFAPVGDIAMMRLDPAQTQDIVPRIIFSLDEVVATNMVRGMIVSIAAGEGYRLDNVLPPDGTTITAEVTQLDASDAAGLPVP